MADDPVSAWAEPWTRKLFRWLTRHRTGVTRAAVAVLASVVGLLAVLAGRCPFSSFVACFPERAADHSRHVVVRP
jgi:hypothetical protein